MRELLALDRRQSLEGTGDAEMRLAFPRRHRAAARRCSPLGFDARGGRRSDPPAARHRPVRRRDPRPGRRRHPRRGVRPAQPRDRRPRSRARRPASSRGCPREGSTAASTSCRRICARKEHRRPTRARSSPGSGGCSRNPAATGRRRSCRSRRHRRPGVAARCRAVRVRAGRAERAPLRCARAGSSGGERSPASAPPTAATGTLHASRRPRSRSPTTTTRGSIAQLEPIGMAVEEHTAQWVSIEGQRDPGRVRPRRHQRPELLDDVRARRRRRRGPGGAAAQRPAEPGQLHPARRTRRAAHRRRRARRDLRAAAQPRPHLLRAPDAHGRRHDPAAADRARQRARSCVATCTRSRSPRSSARSATTDTSRTSSSAESRRARARRASSHGCGRARGTSATPLARVVPAELHEPLGLADWGWVDALVEPSDEDPTHGWLARAGSEVRQDVDDLQELVDEAAAEENFGARRTAQARPRGDHRPAACSASSRAATCCRSTASRSTSSS